MHGVSVLRQKALRTVCSQLNTQSNQRLYYYINLQLWKVSFTVIEYLGK
jgi:hypothetical protein